jgi:poly(3-hydroxybutyrate) depolymerase
MLRSVDAVVQAQHLVAVPYLDEQPDLAADTIRYAQIILQGLRGAASDWSEYENGQRLITLAFRARDGSLQPYQVRLPERWESTKDYPLIIDLHGAGNPDTLGFVAQGFGAERAPARDAGAADKEAIVLLPWGRGNLGYQGFAGQDVWSAIDDAARWLRIDPERLYLSGHSMGGSAAWAFALRTPDRWAAVAIYAGRTWMVPSGIGLGANAANLPIRIQHGDQDGAVPVSEAYAMQKELQVGGGNPVLSIERGGGHETSAAAIKATNTWLLTHKRRRPDRFTFIADTDDHASAWGVELERDPKVSFVPRVECRIQGNVVTLTSSGTPLLRIYPGAQGLGLTGEVTIVWNNKTVYSGAASMVTIDTTTGTATAQ